MHRTVSDPLKSGRWTRTEHLSRSQSRFALASFGEQKPHRDPVRFTCLLHKEAWNIGRFCTTARRLRPTRVMIFLNGKLSYPFSKAGLILQHNRN